MAYPSTFEATTLEENKKRIDQLTTETQPLWGKMNVAQMLAHLNVTYRISRGDLKVEVKPITRFFLKTFVKKSVVGEKPYPKNGQTAPYFLMTEEKDFNLEKEYLLESMKWVFEKGSDFFDGRPTGSFGKLTAKEWSNMFQKHLDHHLKQFGV